MDSFLQGQGQGMRWDFFWPRQKKIKNRDSSFQDSFNPAEMFYRWQKAVNGHQICLSFSPPPWSFVFLELKSTLASGCRIRLEASLGSRHGPGSGGSCGSCDSCDSWVRAELERPVTDLRLQIGDLFRLVVEEFFDDFICQLVNVDILVVL